MIAKLKGRIEHIKPTDCIIDVNGVGYNLTIPLSTYEGIQELNEASLHVFTYHKEDQLKLFGFLTLEEKNIFSILINITGIGPAMAISILSNITIQQLVEAVRREDPSILTQIPGIGKNKAEKLIFELRRKMKRFEDLVILAPEKSSLYSDALEALTSLGFDEKSATQAIESILDENKEIPIEDLVKSALKKLSIQ